MASQYCDAPIDDTHDVAIIGGGPNALRLLVCLRDEGIRVVAFEREKVGHTVAQWYDGSVSHSARHTFQIGNLVPKECQQCLDSVWEGTYNKEGTQRKSECTWDNGHMHCGRDEYMAYMQRVVKTYELKLCEHERVASVERLIVPSSANNRSTLFRLTTNRGAETRAYAASNVVLAFGAISYPRPMELTGRMEGAKISKILGPADDYSGKHVLVVGTGPSGMETAVRLCTSAYNAAHVTLASRSPRLMYAYNLYLNESLSRIRAHTGSGRMTLSLRSTLITANATHATLAVQPAARGSRAAAASVVLRADSIITAVGFTSDTALIKSVGVTDGLIKKDTCETSMRGVYNVGISGVRPWDTKTDSKLLSTFIEDSTPMVKKVCAAVATRVRSQPRRSAPLSAAWRATALASNAVSTATEETPTHQRTVRSVNCSSRLSSTAHDKPPERTAYAVMDYVAARARLKIFVEIGSAHGDLIECVSHAAAESTSIENDPNYCKVLAERARASGGRWTSICAEFPTPQTPAADVYFSWVYAHLNVPFLRAFRAMHDSGSLRPGASLVLAFSDASYKRWNHPVEHDCFRALRHLATQSEDVYFYEGANRRESGTVHMATFEPNRLDKVSLDDASTCCSVKLQACNRTLLKARERATGLVTRGVLY